MDYDVQCDEFDTYEPTEADWTESGERVYVLEEEEDDFSDILGQYQSDFFGVVDTLNGYRV